MQKNKRTANPADLRPPLIINSAVGFLLLGIYILLTGLDPRREHLLYYGILLGGIYTIVIAYVLGIYLVRHRRVTQANELADLMTTEVGDMFRYVVGIPYAVADADGMVKIVSGRLQEILQFGSPVCNIPLNSFCRVPMSDVIGYAETGEPVTDVSVSSDGVPKKTVHPMTTEINDRLYELQCFGMRSKGKDYYFILFHDRTELEDVKKKLHDEDPVVFYVVIDNLQELAQYIRVNYQNAVHEIELRLEAFAAGIGGMLREYDREKYLLVCSRAALEECIRNKFNILDTIRNIQLGDNSFPVTVSIGVGAIKGTMEDKSRAASDALDIAIQKGGDQVAVNDGRSITPYGGRVNTMYGSTTITSRVNSQHLCKLMREAGNILIMGHRLPDYDSIGSCVGLARLAIASREGDPSNIRVVVNREHANFKTCYDMLSQIPDYRQMFISGPNSLDAVRPDTLLIIADVNNLQNTEEPRLFGRVKNVVIVDHHRRQDQMYPFTPLMTYIRPTVAAASELVSEMLEHGPYREKLLKEEANLLLAGLMLDTKNFTQGVGMQTFSTVQYLYSRGAHANAVRNFFTETMEQLFSACDIDSRTRTYRDKIAITWLSIDRPATEEDSITVARAADKLMTIEGIEASFALLRAEDKVTISARSRDRINVQLIMQRMGGGGGHYDMAGCSLKHTNLETACMQLKAVIDDYMDHEYEQEKGMKRS